MSNVKIRIFKGKDFDSKELTITRYVATGYEKKLTAKKAGQILANHFPQFDDRVTRGGLQKTDEGFLAMRTFEATEKCDYHFIWEYALVSDESD